jgi:CDP-paratose 2-epimerase
MKNPAVLITGCAGFIGSHLADHFLATGATVVGVDNLSRNGASENLRAFGDNSRFTFHQLDVRDDVAFSSVVREDGPFDLVIHLAAQVAVTTSVRNPREDFEVNALGTLNVLEAVRLHSPDAFLEFASTNKVYGRLEDVAITRQGSRYEYADARFGIDEKYPLDFYSPYGCSKGTADQYVRDYSRTFGLRTVVLRQSCIYGRHQFGMEDQGWVAWFAIAALLEKPITIYGDGMQVRDVLWVEDLVDAYTRLFDHADEVAGQVFNVGGGPENTLSLLELVEFLTRKGLLKGDVGFDDSRPGDQKVFVSDVNKIREAVGWKPTTSPRRGISLLIDWLVSDEDLLRTVVEPSRSFDRQAVLGKRQPPISGQVAARRATQGAVFDPRST